MFHFKPACWLVLTAVCGPTLAELPVSNPATTGSERAPVFRSALEDYHSFADEKVAPWKESNDTVGKVGGWRAYAREASSLSASPKAGPPAAPASSPAAGDVHKH